jgi:hypothetical protein
MFSRWYSWKISHLVLNNNHSPTLIIMGWTTYVIHTGIFYEKLYNGGNFSTIWQNKTHFHIILSDGWKISAIIKFSIKNTRMYDVHGSFSNNFSKYRVSCVYMKGKFVTNVSFATVRLINHSWDRIKCLASCFIKNIYFLRLLIPWGVNICLYRHNTLNAHFLIFSSQHKP